MMKNYFLTILFLIVNTWISFSQCEESVTNVICADPANNVYIVSPTADVKIEILDANNSPTTGVTWQNPRTFLYYGAMQAGAMTLSQNNFTTEVYFNGSPHSSPAAQNPWPASGAQANKVYPYTYTLPTSAGCPPASGVIYIATGGFTYNNFCIGDNTTLDSVSIVNYPSSQLTWYSDASGTINIPGTTLIQGGQTYYVDLGITGCSQVFPVVIEYATPTPEVELIKTFCSTATWQAAGFNKQGDNLSEVHVAGENITWYSDSAGTQVISDPSTITLTDNDTYYVSQTVNGCESELVPVNMLETTCGCIKNPEIEVNGNQTADYDYVFHTEDYASIQACNNGFDYTTTTNLFTGATGTSDDPNAKISLTGQGNITTLNSSVLSRTSPFSYSENAIRLNDYSPGKTGTTLIKEFIAGEVISFDFAIIAQNEQHPYLDNSGMLFRIFDSNHNEINSKCIVPNECLLTQDGNSLNYYSEWSCMKFNTENYQGEALTIEVTVHDCNFLGHYATIYLDNFYVGENSSSTCSNTVFGEVNIDAVTQTGSSYENCSLLNTAVGTTCSTIEPVVNPSYPLTVCGTYTAPLGASLDDITVNFTSSNNVSYTTNNVNIGTSGDFCVTLNQGDMPNAYGTIYIEAEVGFIKQCNSNNVALYTNINTEGYKNCPVAACPTTVFTCSTSSPAVYDLTAKEVEILANIPIASQGDYSITYYTDQTGAENEDPNFLIANPASYTPASAPSLAYARLDYNYTGLGISPIANCYDLVALNFGIHPMFNIATPIEVEVCNDNGDGFYQFDLSIPTAQITANYPMIDVFYFETMADAQAEVNALPTMYTNVVAYTQTIYVKLKDTYAGCENIVPVNLIIDVPELLAAINPIPTDQESNVTMNASGSNLEVDLSWESGSNYCIDDEMFDVMMGTSPSQLNLVQADITATTFTVQVNANTTYYWQVIPKSSQTTLGNTAPVWEFTTQSLSTDSEVFSNLVYYTNNNQFYVKTSGNTIEQLTIFNLQGKRIMSFSGNQSSEMVVDLAQLSSSVYLAQIKVEGYYKTVKLIKQ